MLKIKLDPTDLHGRYSKYIILYATEDSHSGLEQHEGKLMMTILILNL